MHVPKHLNHNQGLSDQKISKQNHESDQTFDAKQSIFKTCLKGRFKEPRSYQARWNQTEIVVEMQPHCWKGTEKEVKG